MTIRWFDDSPDCGDEACICSQCGELITAEDAPAVRLFDTLSSKEARFHIHCAGPALAEIGEVQR